MNIMAISNGYFRMIGEPTFMKLTLWLDGASGSGKTELAKAVGMYTFYDEGTNKELISVTGNRKYALNRLAQSSGMVCVLDDVKQEQVRERKNSVRNIIDDFIRGVFQGRLTDGGTGKNAQAKWMDTCAVITGEYIETNESQNARIFYLKVDGFLKEERNSQVLRKLQENPKWLTVVCGNYIWWFLKKIQESSFSGLLREYLKALRNQELIYCQINNSERLNENRNMLQLTAYLAENYFRDIGMNENFVSQFCNKAKRSVDAICESTFGLLGGTEAVFLKILERLFSKSTIRKARYEKWKYWEKGNWWKDRCDYYQAYFWINDREDFLWIDDYNESMRKERSGDVNEQSYLIIREKKFEELLIKECDLLVENGDISSKISDEIKKNYLKIAREMQIIYKQYRSDCSFGRPTVKYPVFKRWHSNGECPIDCEVWYEATIQFNTAHQCIKTIKERLEKEESDEEMFEVVENWNVVGKELKEIYQVRKAFTSSKSVYRK